MRDRLRIVTVGDVVLRPDGAVDCNGWHFETPLLAPDQTVDVDPSGGGLAGWTAVELHAIAHGVPCDCPVGRIHAAQGWLD